MPDDTLPAALNDCTAVILAGGQSRRMGRDKASLPFGDSTLLATIIQRLQPLFAHGLLSVQQPLPAFDWPQVTDSTPRTGPLAALVDALAHVETPWAFVTACDMPFVDPALIGSLAQWRNGQQAVIADIDGHWQPFAAFYAKSSLPILRHALQSGERSLTSALRLLTPICVPADELRSSDASLRSFIDLDTPEDWLRHVTPTLPLSPRHVHHNNQGPHKMSHPLAWQDAQQLILQHTPPPGTETLPLEQTLHRVLAESITANRDHPPYDISAMDGYAVRAADLTNIPATLTVIEDIEAGKRPQKSLLAGQCARIMTGAAIPAGADTVIRIEDTKAVATTVESAEVPVLPPHIRILVGAAKGTDIRLRGEHLRTGNTVLTTGTAITPGVFGMLAMLKKANVNVYGQPRVGILSTGDELEGLHDPFDANSIPDANSHSLLAQLQEIGIHASLLGIARDNPQALNTAIQQGLNYDVLLISGGTSVGVHDYVRPVLEILGIQMLFWRVAIRPGHPFAFGTSPTTQIFCLPGNPVSSMVCCELFVLPALRARMGQRALFRRTISARLTSRIRHKPGRTDFQRVTLQQQGDDWLASPIVDQGSGSLLSMAQADGLAIVPAENGGLEAGDKVTVQCFSHLLWTPQS